MKHEESNRGGESELGQACKREKEDYPWYRYVNAVFIKFIQIVHEWILDVLRLSRMRKGSGLETAAYLIPSPIVLCPCCTQTYIHHHSYSTRSHMTSVTRLSSRAKAVIARIRTHYKTATR